MKTHKKYKNPSLNATWSLSFYLRNFFRQLYIFNRYIYIYYVVPKELPIEELPTVHTPYTPLTHPPFGMFYFTFVHFSIFSYQNWASEP